MDRRVKADIEMAQREDYLRDTRRISHAVDWNARAERTATRRASERALLAGEVMAADAYEAQLEARRARLAQLLYHEGLQHAALLRQRGLVVYQDD